VLRLAVALALSLPCAWPPAAALAQSAPAAGSLPTLGDAAREDLSPVLERRLGEEIMHDIRRNRDYLDDDPLIDYLNEFGGALVASYPEARGETNAGYFFFCVRDPMLNAFALPGGFIAVHSALVLAAQSESELASVLGHEIGHVAQRHIARMIGQQKQDVLIPLAALVLAALAAKSSPDAAMGVAMGGQGLAIQRQLNFSRDAEREADRVGFQIMGAGGYDTSGMVAFFQRLQSASRAYADQTPAWLLSHPLTSERIADIQARIRDMPVRQRVDSVEFHLVRARVRVLQDESAAGRQEAENVFKAQLLQLNRQQQAGAQYGLAYLALKRGQLVLAQGWLDKAGATLKPAERAFSLARPGPDGAAMLAGLGVEIGLADGQGETRRRQALADAEAAYNRFPLSRALARQYAEALIANGRLEQATAYLREQVQQYRRDPKLQELLAKSYAGQGKLALQHIALAEAYALDGSVLGALDQLGIARKAGDASFYDLALIDAREREWQQKRRDDIQDAKK
jgi:predicted Zn-dependent protease